MRRRFAERRSEPLDGRVDAAVKIDERVAGPKPLLDLLSQHRFTGAFQKQEQNLKRLLAQFDSKAVMPEVT